ncbi:hypothetical protein GXW83_21835 [Streptacidiphilus sp. PB12-B1b]|uniref:hypothetical protein n=1 Tax=Streptacidiphilus sp. PB12-B1b TaxID=2705012 RepID=UPI0015FB91A6|nr:hypothetical protein [Streptacidiphilus sp. PB12-B1b]QMU77942.1 hypothetical protein GXW83_21835 [Streptacidiphilus sp. PB12-B1b]
MSDDTGAVYADHANLTAAMAKLEAVSGKLRSTTANFTDAMYVPGEAGDPYSDGLQAWLKPSLQGVAQGIQGLGDSVDGTSTGIKTTRDSYSAADHAAGE